MDNGQMRKKRGRGYRRVRASNPTIHEGKRNMYAIQSALCATGQIPPDITAEYSNIKDISCCFMGYTWSFGHYRLPIDNASGCPKKIYKFTNHERSLLVEAIGNGEVGLYKCENRSHKEHAVLHKDSERDEYTVYDGAHKGKSTTATATANKPVEQSVADTLIAEMVTEMKEEIKRLKNRVDLVEGGRRLVIKRLAWFKKRQADYELILEEKERELEEAVLIICDRDQKIHELEEELNALKRRTGKTRICNTYDHDGCMGTGK
ncbi:hypothetical protein BJ508DRAFT_313966 [Ascobolus immersus RN42]|uniref:Uncharacterized protein n=1 Tax=Ascobolus immersus RN42 TaxID=1160509 RepID=A0A3N4HMG1_ASCIM|nr:hypothetical protein BJ508DRAFT_313966 [Ascobolus immersus RN42]